jgi:magnesium-transporting ATPase (P-type)
MVSGDHLETAKRVALDAGLLSEGHHPDAVLTAAQFREKIGPHKIVVDKETQFKTVLFNDIDAFRRVKGKLKVLARATSDDKLILISGIKSK